MIKNSIDISFKEYSLSWKKSLKDVHTKVLDDILLHTSFEVNDIVWDNIWESIITKLKDLR